MVQEAVATTARRVVKNTGALLVGNVFNRFCSLIFWVITARYIGASQFGKFSFALSFAISFLVLSELGFNLIGVREVAADKSLAGKYLGNIAILKLLILVVLLAAVSLVITLLDYPSDTTKTVYIISFSMFFTHLANSLRWSFHAFQKMEYDTLVNAASGILLLSLCFVVLYSGGRLIGLALAHCAVSIFIFCLILFITVLRFDKQKFEIYLKIWKS